MMIATKIGSIEATIRATIRHCTEEDLPQLEWMGLFTPHRQIIRDTFEAQKQGDALMLIAVSARFPIAQVWIDLAAKRAERTAVFWALRTFHPLQGAGIGSRMLSAAERIASDRGYERAELEVEGNDEGLQSFYRKLGWHKAGTGKEGRLSMCKQIKSL